MRGFTKAAAALAVSGGLVMGYGIAAHAATNSSTTTPSSSSSQSTSGSTGSTGSTGSSGATGQMPGAGSSVQCPNM